MAAPEEADLGWEKIGFLVEQGYVGLVCGAYISLTNWSCTCSERHETERFNSERRLRMGLEMEEEEDAKQIVAVGAGTEEERWPMADGWACLEFVFGWRERE